MWEALGNVKSTIQHEMAIQKINSTATYENLYIMQSTAVFKQPDLASAKQLLCANAKTLPFIPRNKDLLGLLTTDKLCKVMISIQQSE